MSLALTRNELIRPQNLIDGKWIDAADAARFPVTNPATGALIVEVANSGAADARAATD
ncbi:MAG: succinate-semialdehyde dehydrogenase (NADP(+)), partial [Paraburkholderia sp.]